MKRVCQAVALIAVVATGVLGLRSALAERADFLPAPITVVLDHPEQLGINGMRVVRFSGAGTAALEGWFVPSRNRASVLLMHGTTADRSALVWEERLLAEHGFGILAFDWPGQGRSEGRPGWSGTERAALAAALDWLLRQPGIDPARVGAFGFSFGGYTLAQVAASDTRLRAVVLAATPSNIFAQTRWEHRKYGYISAGPALLELRLWGVSPADPQPEDVVGSIAPRSVLCIGGSNDATVPEWMVRRLCDRAGAPKEVWIVPEARHGGYASVAPAAYADRLVSFFSRTLLQ